MPFGFHSIAEPLTFRVDNPRLAGSAIGIDQPGCNTGVDCLTQYDNHVSKMVLIVR